MWAWPNDCADWVIMSKAYKWLDFIMLEFNASFSESRALSIGLAMFWLERRAGFVAFNFKPFVLCLSFNMSPGTGL